MKSMIDKKFSKLFWDFIEKHSDKPWNWYELSQNPHITWDIIEQYPDKPWIWCNISKNKFIHQYQLFIKSYQKIQKSIMQNQSTIRTLKNHFTSEKSIVES